MDEQIVAEVLAVVAAIPMGCVASYGQIARLIGRPKNARLVGRVMSVAGDYGAYPCYRVVNHAGRLVPGWKEQRSFLQEEGVLFKADGCVDMKNCQWRV